MLSRYDTKQFYCTVINTLYHIIFTPITISFPYIQRNNYDVHVCMKTSCTNGCKQIMFETEILTTKE